MSTMTPLGLQADLPSLLASGTGVWRASMTQAGDDCLLATLTSNDCGDWAIEVVSYGSDRAPTKNSSKGYFSSDVVPGLLGLLGFRAADNARWKRGEIGEVDNRPVYFIGSDAGLIKIGVSIDPMKRLAEIQSMSPVPLRLLTTIPAAGAAGEAELHQRFADHRSHGEWFRPAPELLSFIAENRSEP